MEEQKYAVVTGGNRGIGFEICRQLALNGIQVILTARNESRGDEAIEKLKASHLTNVVFHQLDIKDPTSVARLVKFVETHFRKLDILVNNAAQGGTIYLDKKKFKDGGGLWFHNEKLTAELNDIENLTEDRIDEIIEWFLRDFKSAKLMTNGWPLTLSAYKVSKVTLIAYTRIMARKFKNILVNCVHPGYCETDMTSHIGFQTAEEGAKGPVTVALLPHDGPSGVYFNQMEMSSFTITKRGLY